MSPSFFLWGRSWFFEAVPQQCTSCYKQRTVASRLLNKKELGRGCTEGSQGLRMLSFPEVIESLTSHSGGGKSARMYFCMGGLPVAERLTWISSLCSLCTGLWPSGPPRGQCFPREGRMKARGLTPQPQGNYQMAKRLFALDDSEQPVTPGKLI